MGEETASLKITHKNGVSEEIYCDASQIMGLAKSFRDMQNLSYASRLAEDLMMRHFPTIPQEYNGAFSDGHNPIVFEGEVNEAGEELYQSLLEWEFYEDLFTKMKILGDSEELIWKVRKAACWKPFPHDAMSSPYLDKLQETIDSLESTEEEIEIEEPPESEFVYNEQDLQAIKKDLLEKDSYSIKMAGLIGNAKRDLLAGSYSGFSAG